jgi:glycerol uptake facilitator-like aquaporin
VSLGLAVDKRFPMKEVPTYGAAQVAGAVFP